MRVLELPDALRRYDVEPVLVAGWETRGNEYPTRPAGALEHWTAGSLRIGIPSLRTLTLGRSDLPGPLCAVGQERAPDDRDDRAYVIASGKANHAGEGEWNGIRGNYRLLGLEIEWAPQLGELVLPPRRRDVADRIMAALIDCTTGDHADIAQHREYARPPGRKVDTNLDGAAVRERVRILRSTPAPTPTPPAGEEEDDQMNDPIEIVKGSTSAAWFATDGITKQWVNGREHAAILCLNRGAKAEVKPASMAAAELAKMQPFVWPQAAVDSIRLVGKAPS